MFCIDRALPTPNFSLAANSCKNLPAVISFLKTQASACSRHPKLHDKARHLSAQAEDISQGRTIAEAREIRPWTFLIPSIDEILSERHWPEMVKDWMTFWAMVFNWLEAYQSIILIRSGKGPGFVSIEQMKWLQISPSDIRKLDEVVDVVVDRIPDLVASGYPVPEEIRGKKPWSVGTYKLKYAYDESGEKYWIRDKILGVNPLYKRPEDPPEEPEWPVASHERPWDNWNDAEYRAFMEKRRAHRRRQAEFARRQSEIGSLQYLDVSPMTDRRMAKDSPFYPIPKTEPTHEEAMDAIIMHGKAVDPETIDLQIRDPEAASDAFLEGVHYVPDTLDFIRSIGHLTESEEILIGPVESIPSATLDEEFPSIDSGPFSELDEDLGDGLEVINEGFDTDDMDDLDADGDTDTEADAFD